jgi:predicted alpha/beta-hydrolase family hydrolase
MTAQAQALSPMDGVRGLAFLGFPLHPAKQPSRGRAESLYTVNVPVLFLQGTRDALAEPAEPALVISALKERATLKEFAEADASFHVTKRSGRSDAAVLSELTASLAIWIGEVTGPRR